MDGVSKNLSFEILLKGNFALPNMFSFAIGAVFFWILCAFSCFCCSLPVCCCAVCLAAASFTAFLLFHANSTITLFSFSFVCYFAVEKLFAIAVVCNLYLLILLLLIESMVTKLLSFVFTCIASIISPNHVRNYYFF